jgi:hypothetical protein
LFGSRASGHLLAQASTTSALGDAKAMYDDVMSLRFQVLGIWKAKTEKTTSL